MQRCKREGGREGSDCSFHRGANFLGQILADAAHRNNNKIIILLYMSRTTFWVYTVIDYDHLYNRENVS